MSIDQVFENLGVDLLRDVPPPDKRTAKFWALLIGTARKLERRTREERDRMRDEHQKQSDGLALENARLSAKVAELQDKLALAAGRIAGFEIDQRMREIRVPKQDARFILTGVKDKDGDNDR